MSKLFLTTPSLGVTKNNLDTPGCRNLHSGSYRASAFIGRPRFLSSWHFQASGSWQCSGWGQIPPPTQNLGVQKREKRQIDYRHFTTICYPEFVNLTYHSFDIGCQMTFKSYIFAIWYVFLEQLNEFLILTKIEQPRFLLDFRFTKEIKINI